MIFFAWLIICHCQASAKKYTVVVVVRYGGILHVRGKLKGSAGAKIPILPLQSLARPPGGFWSNLNLAHDTGTSISISYLSIQPLHI